MIRHLKSAWRRLTQPDQFIGVSTDDRMLDRLPAQQAIFPMQVWVPKLPDSPIATHEVYVESVDTGPEQQVTYAPTSNPGATQTINRQLFLRHYVPGNPDRRFNVDRGEATTVNAPL